MSLLQGFRVVQVGPGLATAVCGRLLADVGAEVACIDPAASTPLVDYLDCGTAFGSNEALIAADLIICDSTAADFRNLNATAAIVVISPFGQTGAKAGDP